MDVKSEETCATICSQAGAGCVGAQSPPAPPASASASPVPSLLLATCQLGLLQPCVPSAWCCLLLDLFPAHICCSLGLGGSKDSVEKGAQDLESEQ